LGRSKSEALLKKDSFIDHYEALQISSNARSETVQRVYRLLAQMYHPDNTETGDVEMFKAVLDAYKVLSDPESRAAYDVEHRAARERRWKIFDQSHSVQGIDSEKRKRIGILSLLYSKRMHESYSPTLGIVEFEQLLGCPREHLELSLWYLRESGRIQRSDNGKYVLTAKGLEFLEDQMDQPQAAVNFRLLEAPHPVMEPQASRRASA
jgi:curved DNA-binding protein CbpA